MDLLDPTHTHHTTSSHTHTPPPHTHQTTTSHTHTHHPLTHTRPPPHTHTHHPLTHTRPPPHTHTHHPLTHTRPPPHTHLSNEQEWSTDALRAGARRSEVTVAVNIIDSTLSAEKINPITLLRTFNSMLIKLHDVETLL